MRRLGPVTWCVLCTWVVGHWGWADVQTQQVQYQQGQTSLVGYLAYDDTKEGRRPGVLVIHAWWGLNPYAKQRAVQLAELGYVAFALDMYGAGKTTADAAHAKQWSDALYGTPLLRQRAQAGLAVLAAHERVDPARMAAIGYCFGGSTVLELAYSGAEIKGVVSFHGGVPLPKPGDTLQTKAKILICHGADDPFVPAERRGEFKRALDGSGVDWLWISYGGAVHSFTYPQADQAGIEGVSYQPAADQRSWGHMKQFFDEIFGKNAQPQ